MVVQYIVDQISGAMSLFYMEFGVKTVMDSAPFSIWALSYFNKINFN